MSAPREIIELVEGFGRRINEYRSSQYNETELRDEFVNPFFAALGWDVHNQQGLSSECKEVKLEESIRVEEGIKNPDYSFRIGKSRKFFVETKKPSINIEGGVYPAFQLRRYAWSASLPVSILTDFEEFAVYDCRAQPSKTDKPGKGRLLYLQYDQYVERWDEIAALFSREAVDGGSLERFIESIPEKRGIKRVDAALLDEISLWREVLARNIASRNPDLSQRDLNFSVQRTIDRLLFLRICEDRAIEEYGRLKARLKEVGVYARLLNLFAEANERYNSGIFHFQAERERAEPPDSLTTALIIDDATLKEIIQDLYFPDSPYVFSEIPAEILGQVYEQFLGKVIRLEEGRKAIVEDKPEVRKAGGVYYTPSYIVDYIVKNTVGKLLEGSTPAKAAKLRILDPACGSGSFLIGAYQFLLDWHLEWYRANLVPLLEKNQSNASPDVLRLLPGAPEQRSDRRARKIHARAAQASLPIFKASGSEWRLTTTERKRILQSNIYGVDIDSQAVEVTKLSLLLKVLEGETEEIISSLLRFFKERALPDLGSNIKCGNSLIGYDYYDNHRNLSAEEVQRINAFEWKTEFPEVFKRGGFDAVIGNPPYLRMQGLQENYHAQIGYFLNRYQSATKRFDFYLLFIEKGFNLLSLNGYLGFICPNKFVNSDFGSGIRQFLIDNQAIQTYINFGHNLIFNQASTYTSIIILIKNRKPSFNYFEFSTQSQKITDIEQKLRNISQDSFAEYYYNDLTNSPWTLTHKNTYALLKKLMNKKNNLGDVMEEIMIGVQAGINNIHLLKFIEELPGGKLKLLSEMANKIVEIESVLAKPCLMGEDIHRYKEPINNHYIIYPYELTNGKTVIMDEEKLKNVYPLGYAYLERFKQELTEIRTRQKTNPIYWYSCHRSKDMDVFEKKRIVTPDISLGSNMTVALGGMYQINASYSIVPSCKRHESVYYWLGILNSRLMWWFLSNTGTVLRGGYFRFTHDYLEPFPVPDIDVSKSQDLARHDRMVELVQSMLDLHKQASAGTDHDLGAARRIEATDRQIDRLVYELYDLTEEEIGIVEAASK